MGFQCPQWHHANLVQQWHVPAACGQRHAHTHTRTQRLPVSRVGQSAGKRAARHASSGCNWGICVRGRETRLTVASSSNFPNSSFRSLTSSWAVHWEARLVKPTISANRMLWRKEKEKLFSHSRLFIAACMKERKKKIIGCRIRLGLCFCKLHLGNLSFKSNYLFDNVFRGS